MIFIAISIFEMRSYVAKAYCGDAWKKKVKHMSDSQIIAIYNNLISRKKKTNKPKESAKVEEKPVDKLLFKPIEGEQLHLGGF